MTKLMRKACTWMDSALAEYIMLFVIVAALIAVGYQVIWALSAMGWN